MAIVNRFRNRYFFVLDVVFLIAAVYLSYVLRLETFTFKDIASGFVFFGGLAAFIIPGVFYLFGLYTR